jgi:hypothetical protein
MISNHRSGAAFEQIPNQIVQQLKQETDGTLGTPPCAKFRKLPSNLVRTLL